MRYVLTLCTAFILVVAASAAAEVVPATQPTSQTAAVVVDLTSPKAAMISYFRAMQRHDMESAKKTVVVDATCQELWDATAATHMAKTKYVEAARAKFGDKAAKRLAPDVMATLIMIVERSSVKEDGDTAEIGEHGDYPCRRVGGEWRYDYARRQKDTDVPAMMKYMETTKALYEGLAQDIAKGKYATAEEVLVARNGKMPAPPKPLKAK